ncbi:N-acetyl-gamma-glutamyl-phosphate reductase [Actinomyces sp. B33]|uniref:N-acetyl-gamma-glutamyl-phosphate reductase n=1 Tax=Actinomyces sp. B33 TaxID=2942131 RepID=UPI002340B06D|nr:N-acetyl-gamma-glutamyl-phosphate reductase [Actinomyces sp. B33]MDC4233000.1 N-acetyl-gamma-glutamyl-phosphate reductase [Actinomyces sp. B33]
MMLTAAVAGASGYAGGEALRILASHPSITVTTVTAGASAGARLSDLHPHIPSLGDLVIEETTPEALAGHDLVVLALPHGHSGAIGDALDRLDDTGVIADCAADHRLTNPEEWRRYYGGGHAGSWTYGMPELLHAGETRPLAQRRALSRTGRIAVPGCNVTAVTLAIQPAVAAGLVDASHLTATLAVGYSGAGRALKPHLLASQALGTMAPYGVGGTHRHIPEILQNLTTAGGADLALTFTPVLVPVSRGILATVVAPLVDGVDAQRIEEAYRVYADEPLVDVLAAGSHPTTGPLTGTGRAAVSTSIDERAGTLTAIAAIDNLGKGTAAAAVQSANIALGLDEYAGVPMIGVAP